ncbi:hypothetical protein [Patulibacter sp. SYSU D01012]|uniref:hypothetical protein n=1 Tax=Patulibacter sp. SYSU D01012 TaxID=2817381 RepID=UPI001B305342|nr:hypothetical protein [Patulibacter sp. SYSU D01012]
MAADATPETTTATVLRATERQVRLQLDGGREVTKRVTVPADVRETIEGAKVPVTVSGTGDRAKVELGDDWLDVATGKKKPARRRRSGAKADASATAKTDAPAAKTDDAKAAEAPKRKRTRGGAKPADDAPAEAAKTDEAAVAESTAEVAEVAETTEAPKRSRSRSRGGKGRGKAKATETADAPAEQAAEAPAAEATPAAPAAPEVVALDPKVVLERIDAAVQLVRGARR